ncbi:MAG: glycosyltransferase [Clostridium sp.]|nr:glycosyltransferase [Clostridium sp.]
MKPLISIIIPVYNVENYLDECIRSVVNQSYDNLDIIIINDGSTDNSENIIKKWGEKDKRIRIFTQENSGISNTRTKALSYVLGEYIGWVDSDDIIDSHMYETLVSNIINENADISICDYRKFNEDEKIFLNKQVNKYNSINDSIVKKLIKGEITGFLWDKLFKKELFNNIIFPEYSIGEDFYINLNILTKSKKIVISDFIGYYYRERKGSLLNSDNIEDKESLLECDKAAIKFINANNNIHEKKWMNYRFISDNLLIHHQTKNVKSKEIKELNKILKKNILSAIFKIPIFMNYNQFKNILYAIAFLIGLK